MSTVKKISGKVSAVAVAFVMLICVLAGFPSRAVAEEKEMDFAAMSEELAFLINEAREDAGLEPLKIVPYLCDISQIRARECITLFSHERPDYISDFIIDDKGEKYFGFETAIDLNLVPFMWAGENIAAGNSTPQATFEQWKASPSHWGVIMNPNYTHLGVSVTYEENDARNHHYYWEALFIGCGLDLKNQYSPRRERVRPVSTGDINGDGEIDSFDLITINKYLAQKTEFNELQMDSADLLKDGIVNSDDAEVLKMYLLGECATLPMTFYMLLKIYKERK